MITKQLEEIEKRYRSEMTVEKHGDGWIEWWKDAPSRLLKLEIAVSFAINRKSREDPQYDVDDESDPMYKEHKLVQSLLTKDDWEYNKTYCMDGRYKRWCSEMQAKAPDTHPEGWD